MHEDEVLAAVSAVIRDVLDEPSLKIGSNTTADSVEGWDSMNHINIIAMLEKRFKIKFKTAEIEELRNVNDLVTVISRKIA